MHSGDPASSALGESIGSHALAVHYEVRYLTRRLIEEYPEFPAGSVMRCVARATRRALMARMPHGQLVTRTEHTARAASAARLVARDQHLLPTLPPGIGQTAQGHRGDQAATLTVLDDGSHSGQGSGRTQEARTREVRC
jgi:hypothetical protein